MNEDLLGDDIIIREAINAKEQDNLAKETEFRHSTTEFFLYR